MNTLVNVRHFLTTYQSLFRPLDFVMLGLAMITVMVSFRIWQQPNLAKRLQIYQEGKLYQEIDLSIQKTVSVKGPLGITRIDIQHGKARIAADPSPRQYCVKAGWLHKVGQLAICLPNHTSIVIVGKNHEVGYDSLNY